MLGECTRAALFTVEAPVLLPSGGVLEECVRLYIKRSLTAILISLFFIFLGAVSVATQSDDSLGLDDIGFNRPQLSKDLQDVYDTLMNFQKRDSQSFSLETPVKNVKKNESFDDSDQDDRLSQILAAYGVKPNKSESVQVEPKKSEYFIPVDYETYSKWVQEKKISQIEKMPIHSQPQMPIPPQNQKNQPQMPIQPKIESQPKMPIPAKFESQPKMPIQDQDDQDTSQDAADLTTQESQKEPIEANVQIIGHPDSEDDSKNDLFERDVNFVIESDNVDEKLYSSESESLPKKLVLSSSSSASKSVELLKKNPKDAPKALQIHSESESEPKKKQDDDLSGPEVEDVDDFWN